MSFGSGTYRALQIAICQLNSQVPEIIIECISCTSRLLMILLLIVTWTVRLSKSRDDDKVEIRKNTFSVSRRIKYTIQTRTQNIPDRQTY
ncbi:hypothetical protein Leryth_024164 [Lithospermum erythrorhizon]|nr:hypothetical protein Leryth_024164 [Lithospermum erythrorhizon]